MGVLTGPQESTELRMSDKTSIGSDLGIEKDAATVLNGLEDQNEKNVSKSSTIEIDFNDEKKDTSEKHSDKQEDLDESEKNVGENMKENNCLNEAEMPELDIITSGGNEKNAQLKNEVKPQQNEESKNQKCLNSDATQRNESQTMLLPKDETVMESKNKLDEDPKTLIEEGQCFSHQNENKDGNNQESNSSVVQKVENCQGEQDTSSEGERNARKASFQQSNLSEDDEGNEADEEDEGEKEDEQEKKDENRMEDESQGVKSLSNDINDKKETKNANEANEQETIKSNEEIKPDVKEKGDSHDSEQETNTKKDEDENDKKLDHSEKDDVQKIEVTNND